MDQGPPQGRADAGAEPSVSPKVLVLLFLVLCTVWFGTLQQRKLIKPDEGRYAEIAREMAVSGDWITPRLDGIKYFEKPPLQYWATAAAFKAFGESEWTARLWTAVTGFISILLVFLTGRRLFDGQTAFYGSAVAATMFLLLGMAHVNTLDMGLACFLQLALSGFLLAQTSPPHQSRRWMLVAWAGLALAVLSKGLVAVVLLGGALVLYSLICRDFSPWRRLEIARGLVLFLLIAAPWFVAVGSVTPEFFRFFFIHEHFERFLTQEHGRYQPWWYFVPILLLGALPWTSMLPQAMRAAWHRDGGEKTFRPNRFLVIWIALVFVFFSASGSKLASYILPLFPALGLLVGIWLRSATPRSIARHMAVGLAFAAVLGTLALSIPGSGVADSRDGDLSDYALWLAWAAALWGLGSAAALFAARKGQRDLALVAVSVSALFAGTLVLLGHDELNQWTSAHYVAEKARPQIPERAPFYSVETFDHTLPFYLKRTVTLVQYRDELSFGLDLEPDKAVPTLDEFKRRWEAEQHPFAFMLVDMYDTLRAAGLPMEIIARDQRRIIVKKP